MKKKSSPFVSVIMPAYNCEDTIKESIDSILLQSYDNFELIIINDGSIDNTLDVINSYNDDRIIVINNKVNQTIVPCLNKGLKNSKGKYIIRMDSDDICVETRFEKQVLFMEKNTDIGVCGSWAKKINYKNENVGNMIYNSENDVIKFKMLHECHLLHPSIIIRKSVLSQNNLSYNPKHYKSEDYDLFTRLIDHTKFSNIKEYLLKYRVTKTSLKRETSNELDEYYYKIKINIFRKIGIELKKDQIDLYTSICNQNFLSEKKLFLEAVKLLENILNANKKSNYFPKSNFNNYLQTIFTSLCRNYKSTNLLVVKTFYKANIYYPLHKKFKILIILSLKTIHSTFILNK